MGIRSFKIGWLAKGAFALATLGLLAAAAVPANAASLRRSASPGANGSGTNGGPTGNYLFTWYDTGVGPTPPGTATGAEPFGNGDNVMRLVDPNGCGNSGVGGVTCSTETDLCAMIYVFDDDQEMGECCGCSITPNELETFSTTGNLTNNWGLGVADNGSGVIVVVGSAKNVTGGLCNPNNPSCNHGCDPTVNPSTGPSTNLDGSMTHNQIIGATSGLTEIALFDQGSGDTTNNAYLVASCGAIIGNASGRAGFCHCPTDDTP